MAEKRNILDVQLEELREYLLNIGEKSFRAEQIYKWLFSGIESFSAMTNISKVLLSKIENDFYLNKLKISKKFISQIDGTIKYLYQLSDGNIIETVLMKYKHGNSICISSQIGCRMGCSFCASSGLGFIRNLSAGEMIDQILMTINDTNEKISNIVIMGIGEPLDNYENLIIFLKNINNKVGLNIGYRHISVSTCGLVDKIYDFLQEKLPVTLSISLHSVDPGIREKLMPITKRHSIDKLIKACKIYTETLRRRITFEYTLIEGVNDTKSEAFKVVKRLKGLLCHVNLIPVNEIKNNNNRRSKKSSIESFQAILIENGIETTIRRELGKDIEAACGQLRRSNI